jgi:polar amino acid transport system substrate-binding protein
MPFTRKPAFALSAVAAIVCAAALGSAVAQPTMTLRVGSTGAGPFGLAGVCTPLMDAIAAEAGFTIEYAPAYNLTTLYPALIANEIDIACSAINASNELRAQGVAFTSPVYLNRGAIIVLNTDTTPYARLSELQGKTVGVTAGSAYIGQLNNAGVTTLREYPSNMDALNALIAGEVQAVVQGETSIRFFQVQGLFPELRWAETYAPNSPVTYPAIGVRAAEFELLGRVQAALQKMKGDGTLATMTEGFGLAATPPNL